MFFKKQEQSLNNHTAVTPLQHFIWLPLGLIMLVSTIAYMIISTVQGSFSFLHILLPGMVILSLIPGMLARKYALTLQDRLIKTEETLRYYILTQKRIDSKITADQFIGLRFASDDEFVSLVQETIEEDLTKDEIKQRIKNWRADNHRV